MSTPTDRKYAQTHEWHLVSGDTVTLGLTKFAVDQLTDVTYVDMKPPGTVFKAGDSIGVVESVKTTSDVYCACDGEVVEVNQKLATDPSLVNSAPYSGGWLVKIKITGRGGIDSLLDAAQYDSLLASH